MNTASHRSEWEFAPKIKFGQMCENIDEKVSENVNTMLENLLDEFPPEFSLIWMTQPERLDIIVDLPLAGAYTDRPEWLVPFEQVVDDYIESKITYVHMQTAVARDEAFEFRKLAGVFRNLACKFDNAADELCAVKE